MTSQSLLSNNLSISHTAVLEWILGLAPASLTVTLKVNVQQKRHEHTQYGNDTEPGDGPRLHYLAFCSTSGQHQQKRETCSIVQKCYVNAKPSYS